MPYEIYNGPFGKRVRKIASAGVNLAHLWSQYFTSLGWYGGTPTAPPVAPVRTAQPVIAGSTTAGSVLTCTPGTYTGTPTPTITRQWMAGLVDIPGATGLTYTIQAADSGKLIACKELATNSAGTATGTSNNIIAA